MTIEKPMFTRMPMCNKMDWVEANYSAPWIIYDTETTGLKADDRIVQLSAVKLERKNGSYQPVDTLNMFIKPPFPMPKEASDVNHITDDMLKDMPSEEEAFPKIRAFFGDLSKNVISGYNNIHFDDKMMGYMYERCAGEKFSPIYSVDFIHMAHELVYRKDISSGRYTLTDVSELYGIKEDTMHSSDTDVYVTGQLAWAMLSDYRGNYKSIINSQKDRARARVTSMWGFQKSKVVNYVYFTVNMTDNAISKTSKFHYDIWNKRIVEDGTDDGEFISNKINLLALSDEIDRKAGGDVSKFKGGKK